MTRSTTFLRYSGLVLVLVCAGCLKTRAQLREDGDDGAAGGNAQSQGVKTQISDVQPQGGYAIDDIKATITQMEGRLEDVERAQKKPAGPTPTIEDLKKIDQRVTELEQAQAEMLAAIKKLQDSAPVADPEELLKSGRDQFEGGDYEQAIATISTYLKQPHLKKSEEATFLRAEAYYNLKQYKKAIVDYSRFPEKFTRSKRMPLVLYKIGLSFNALGMHDDAKTFFEDLVTKFPKSPEAKKARKKLK